MKELHARVAAEVHKVVLGHDEAIENMLAALALAGTSCSRACREWARPCSARALASTSTSAGCSSRPT